MVNVLYVCMSVCLYTFIKKNSFFEGSYSRSCFEADTYIIVNVLKVDPMLVVYANIEHGFEHGLNKSRDQLIFKKRRKNVLKNES